MNRRRGLALWTAFSAVVGWELLVRWAGVPVYLLPPPSRIGMTLVGNLDTLAPAWWFTVQITFGALVLAAVGGVMIASVFALFPGLEAAFFPFAVTLQVTPVVAVAPLILIYVDSTTAALLVCAWVVSFFPILANTLSGLRAADANLRDLFQLCGASRLQRLRWLLIPTALPYFLSGLRICGGLSLIAAVTAEMVAGAAGRETGLASRILESSFRSDTPRMFAALSLLVLTGLLIHFGLNFLSNAVLRRWHPSAQSFERVRSSPRGPSERKR